jgi:hypothetical protein
VKTIGLKPREQERVKKQKKETIKNKKSKKARKKAIFAGC